MTFLEFSCYVIPGSLVVAGIAHFVKKAYRRWIWNRQMKRFDETIKAGIRLGLALSTIAKRREMEHELKRRMN